jgi:hypothetical protein
MSWRWDYFLIYCVALILTGWGVGFLIPAWLALCLAAVLGYWAGSKRWFDVASTSPKRMKR